MDAFRFVEALEMRLKQDIQARRDQLYSGNMPDLAEYKNVCGQLRGLEFALEHAKSLLQNLREIDD